jgi:hypothetical protein
MALGLKNLFKAGGVTLNRERQHWKMRYITKYTFWAIFCVLFHVDTLSGSKDTHVEALLSNILCANPFGDEGTNYHQMTWFLKNNWLLFLVVKKCPAFTEFHSIFPHRSTTTNFQI